MIFATIVAITAFFHALDPRLALPGFVLGSVLAAALVWHLFGRA
jgi:hypothetical protein